jgi:lantibiotic modifying enzyme
MRQRCTSDCYYTNAYNYTAFIHVLQFKNAHMGNTFAGRKTIVVIKIKIAEA